ncbi:uncharacterized protein [Drosophila bipectinata]|uniref:uncharacterized protein n=1 Tax=Drosophila bipectinata TaxID=42026 RepID=UPI0038B2CAAD
MKAKYDKELEKLLEEDFLNELQEEKEMIREEAKENIAKIQDEKRKSLNKSRKPESEYKLGDLVAIKRTQFGAVALDVVSRRTFAKDTKLCFNGLSRSHQVRDCNSSNTCRQCNAKHHTLVHPIEARSVPVAPAHSTAADTNTAAVSHHILERANNPALLPTVVANVIDTWGNETSSQQVKSNATIWTKIRSLPLADPTFGSPGKIDVILGADQLWNLYTGHRREFVIEYPIALHTNFGWEPRTPIGSTLPQALNRFAALERKFRRFPALKQQYVDFMDDYLNRGHMELIPAAAGGEDPARYNYLAHHAVFKPDSTTTRCRVVFDGSGKDSTGHSLNSRLHIGPPIQRELIGVCLRFRQHRYVFCADIEMMFRGILVSDEHTQYQRIVWRKDENATLDHYRLLTLSNDYAELYPTAAVVLNRDAYLDDSPTGCDNIKNLIALKDELILLLSEAQFKLRKWSSNCYALLKSLPKEIYSEIVLHWLTSPPRTWNTYVFNRTAEILEVCPRSCWQHIRSGDNPADCASRGVLPKDLVDHQIWWNGPPWLSQLRSAWPPVKAKFVLSTEEEACLEMKAETKVNLHISNDGNSLSCMINKSSSWSRLLRIVSYCLRFVHRLRERNRLSPFLSAWELQYARAKIFTHAQEEFFNVEYKQLTTGQPLSKKSKLIRYTPFLDEQRVMRVGDRIDNSIATYDAKHPILLPKESPIAGLLVRYQHAALLHAGVEYTFHSLRQRYWILGARNLVRKTVFNCRTCFLQRRHTSSQLMADLPEFRVQPARCFLHTGLDYAGPVSIKTSTGRTPRFGKAWFAIFVCLSTKAIHIELVSDLTTSAFIAAFKRFWSRRGPISDLYSDNGTIFNGAKRDLAEMQRMAIAQSQDEEISSFMASHEINWHFIPPSAPHFGGIWETGVRSIKLHLKRVIGSSALTFEEYSTLSASHFGTRTIFPECKHQQTAALETTTGQDAPNVDVDTLVVLKEPNQPSSKWILGRVTEVHPGQDQRVRVVTVKTPKGIYKRPITKIAVLPLN